MLAMGHKRHICMLTDFPRCCRPLGWYFSQKNSTRKTGDAWPVLKGAPLKSAPEPLRYSSTHDKGGPHLETHTTTLIRKEKTKLTALAHNKKSIDHPKGYIVAVETVGRFLASFTPPKAEDRTNVQRSSLSDLYRFPLFRHLF